MSVPVYWSGPVAQKDDFGRAIAREFIDGRTRHGPWAIMSPESWAIETGTFGLLGLGRGQRFKKQNDGKWLQTEG